MKDLSIPFIMFGAMLIGYNARNLWFIAGFICIAIGNYLATQASHDHRKDPTDAS